MDPLLHELAAAGAGDDEVELILKLRSGGDVPPGVRIVARFGEIATCRVRRGRIAATWHHQSVVSAKAPRLVAAEVEPPWSEETGTLGDALPESPHASAATGRGVVVGLVDWGLDVAHPNFRRDDGSTRLLALWDQSASAPHATRPRYGYGRVHDRARIDRALATGDPYLALGYDPKASDPFDEGAHGTHVCDIAAGNGRAPGTASGMAPEAELVFVHLAATGTGGLATLGDTCRILEALDFVARTAGSRPWVVNLSVGRCGGPHDGRTLVEQGMDQLLLQAPGRAIVQSTGNYHDTRGHAGGQLRPGERRTLTWRTDAADITPNELEVWYPGLDALAVELRSPDGSLVARLALDEHVELRAAGRPCGRAYHRRHDPGNGDHHVDIFLWPGAPAGAWRVTLVGVDVVDGRFDAWVERDSACAACQSRFDAHDAIAARTTGTICNAFRTIAVGAYDSRDPTRALARFSSSGPTRDGRQKPDLCAPGVRIRAARSATRPGDPVLATVKSGTSMAAPQVAGTIACMFEVASRPLWIHETRRLLLGSASGSNAPPALAARLGSGYLDPARAIAAARETAAIDTSASPSMHDPTRMVAMRSFGEDARDEDRYADGFEDALDVETDGAVDRDEDDEDPGESDEEDPGEQDDPDFEEETRRYHFVLVSGGPGPFDDRDVEHDASWANYVTPPLLLTDTRAKRAAFHATDEDVWWFVHKPSYERRWAEDSRSRAAARKAEVKRVRDLGFASYVELVEARAADRGWKLRWMAEADDLWKKLRTFRDGSISRVWYWGHARDDLWLSVTHDPANGEAMAPAPDEIIEVADIDATLKRKFRRSQRGRQHRFIGCNTDAFAKAWATAYDAWSEGVDGKVHFKAIHGTGGEPCLIAGASVSHFKPGGTATAAGTTRLAACGASGVAGEVIASEQQVPPQPAAPQPQAPPPPAPQPYGGYALRRGDHDDRRRYAGRVRSAAAGDVLPAAGTTPFVQQLQEDLRTLGFHVVGTPDRDFGRSTEWAVREFQIYAAMPSVAQEALPPAPPAVAPARYVDRLSQVANAQQYAGAKSGVVNADTRRLLQHWIANRWRCPVVVEAYNVNAAGVRTLLRNENIWRHDEVRVGARRMFVRDFSGYYTMPAGRNANDLIELGHFARYGTRGGPSTESRAHVWTEGEMLPEHLIGRPLAQLTAAERSTYKVVRAVAEVECNGFFDGLNAYDDVFVSLGPYHWAAGKAAWRHGDLGAYLAWLRDADAAAFEQAIGFFGLRPSRQWATAASPAGRGLFAAGSRRHVAWLALAAEGGAFDPIPFRDSELHYLHTWHWFYRFVMAGRTIAAFREQMWPHARRRVRDILQAPWGAGVPPIPVQGGAPRPATIGDVFTSERAIALLLRWHVRCPAHVVANGSAGTLLRGAFVRAAIPASAGDPSRWTDAHEQRLIDAIMAEVAAIATGCGSGGGLTQTMTSVRDWPTWVGAAANNRWRYALDATIGPLSAVRNSLDFDTTGIEPSALPAPAPAVAPAAGAGGAVGPPPAPAPAPAVPVPAPATEAVIAFAEELMHAGGRRLDPAAIVGAPFAADAAEGYDVAGSTTANSRHSPALLFDAFAGPRTSSGRSRELAALFDPIGQPRRHLVSPLEAGDVLVRRPVGEARLAHAGMLLTGELVPDTQLARRGWRAERAAPGWYALVIEGGPFPHCGHRPFARRILDQHGAVPVGQLLLRAKLLGALARDLEIGSDPREDDAEAAITTVAVRNRLLRWDAVPDCEIELSAPGTPPVRGRTSAHGTARLDLAGLADGTYTLRATPAHASTDPVGPALASSTPRPTRIWRPLVTTLTVSGERIVASSDANVTASGASVAIRLQPVWITSPNESARAGGAAAVTGIIVHHTAGPLIGPALNTFVSATEQRSAHYVIDTDGQVVKMVHEDRAAWHAGRAHWRGRDDVNDTTVGIEVVHRRGQYPAAQYDALIALLQRIRATYPAIDADDIVGHADVATCPSPGNADCSRPPRRLGRKIGDPGLDFEWERLEAVGLGVIVPTRATLDPMAYGGFFTAVPAGRLQTGDRDADHRYGGAIRPGITADVIRELQRDLRTIGYFCPDSGAFDSPTQGAVSVFQDHFFAGTRPRAARTGQVDRATAERIKALLPAPVAAGAATTMPATLGQLFQWIPLGSTSAPATETDAEWEEECESCAEAARRGRRDAVTSG